jgi:hypothetical protein
MAGRAPAGGAMARIVVCGVCMGVIACLFMTARAAPLSKDSAFIISALGSETALRRVRNRLWSRETLPADSGMDARDSNSAGSEHSRNETRSPLWIGEWGASRRLCQPRFSTSGPLRRLVAPFHTVQIFAYQAFVRDGQVRILAGTEDFDDSWARDYYQRPPMDEKFHEGRQLLCKVRRLQYCCHDSQ